jgi:hypothetical protein
LINVGTKTVPAPPQKNTVHPKSISFDCLASRELAQETDERGDIAGLRIIFPAMAVNYQDELAGLSQTLQRCLTGSMLIEIEKVTTFIELHKRTRDRHAGRCDSFDLPTLTFSHSINAGRIKSHRVTVQTKSTTQHEADPHDRDKNCSNNDKD